MALVEQFTREVHKSQNYVILNDGNLFKVPEGADPDFVRKVQNNILENREAKANGTTKKTSRRNSTGHRNSSRVNYARLAVANATLETVERVNESKPDPTMDENIITIHSAGGTTYVNREDWGLSYA